MPVTFRYLGDYAINWVKASEPFELNDLFELARSRMGPENAHPDLANPLLLDLRDVELLRSSSDEIRALVRKRASFGAEYSNNPAAFLAKDEGSYGMLRMFTAYSEVWGLRTDQNTLITLDLTEAASWLISRSGAPVDELPKLLKLVA